MNYLQLQRKSEEIFKNLSVEFMNSLIPLLNKELKIYNYELGDCRYFNTDMKVDHDKLKFRHYDNFKSEVWLKIKKPLKNGGNSYNRFSFDLIISNGKIKINRVEYWLDMVDTKILKVGEARKITDTLLSKLRKIQKIINERNFSINDEDIKFAFLNFTKYSDLENEVNKSVRFYIKPYLNGRFWKNSDMSKVLKEFVKANKIKGSWVCNDIILGKNIDDAFNFILHNKQNHLVLPFINKQFPEVVECRNFLKIK